jgi:hypothetical protein
MSKHTAGPWTVETPMDEELSIVQAGLEAYEWQFIATCPIGTPADGSFSRQQAKANARLIAAAPCLLTALVEAQKAVKLLEDLTACGSDDDYVDGLQETISAAIAKATGAALPPTKQGDAT